MATLSIASAKGGVGKTTVAISVAGELALDGYRVALLDCDLNQHASHFGKIAEIEGLTVVPAIDEKNVLPALRKAQAENDLVVIDLPGGSSTLALKALHRSNFVLIPCQATLPDVRDAIKTVEQIDDAQELASTKIARSLIWTRVMPGFESRSAKHVRKSIEGQGVPVFRTSMMQRAALAEFHLTGKLPRQIEPNGATAANVAAITAELLANLEQLAQAA
ncbi:MAG: AAA family ATPase [Acetobacteraceae bacterium]